VPDPDERPPRLADEGPTELVEDDRGELVERLSRGTATLLLAWLIGIGAFSALLAAWVFVRLVYGVPLGLDSLFGPIGFYVGLAGASGPCILWLTGRAQGHSFGWFVLTALKMGAVMLGLFTAITLGGALVLSGTLPGAGALRVALILIGLGVPLAVAWALATWLADRWIARARLAPE
jgi:hypothetical protein